MARLFEQLRCKFLFGACFVQTSLEYHGISRAKIQGTLTALLQVLKGKMGAAGPTKFHHFRAMVCKFQQASASAITSWENSAADWLGVK